MCLRERDAIIGNARFRFPRKVEEETALVSEARTQSTKYKEKWAVEIFENGKGREHLNFRVWKLEPFSKITTFISCVMSRIMWRTWIFLIELVAC